MKTLWSKALDLVCGANEEEVYSIEQVDAEAAKARLAAYDVAVFECNRLLDEYDTLVCLGNLVDDHKQEYHIRTQAVLQVRDRIVSRRDGMYI